MILEQLSFKDFPIRLEWVGSAKKEQQYEY